MMTGRRDEHPLRTRLGTLILIRWLAIGGQSLTALAVQMTIGGLAVAPVVATIGASALLNGVLTLQGGAFRRLDQRTAAWHIAFDLLQICILVALTGGLKNPFCIFIIGPVALAAATLPGRSAFLVAILALAMSAGITWWHRPLPWRDVFLVPSLYTFGIWVALSLAIGSVAYFTWRMASESRSLDAAYEASRAALLREQRVAAVGGLAAMVAHELNTPLATVCLVAREVTAQMAEDNPLLAEMQVLVGQAERCRDILGRLSRRGEREALVGEETVPFSSLVEMAAAPHRQEGIEFEFSGSRSEVEPWVVRSPEILQGLGNLLQNAAQFATRTVKVTTDWLGSDVSVRIHDDGSGFAQHLLDRLGEPYLSTRDGDGTHFGLGIFIACTLLSRTGARLAFANHPAGGAMATVSWRKADLIPANATLARPQSNRMAAGLTRQSAKPRN